MAKLHCARIKGIKGISLIFLEDQLIWSAIRSAYEVGLSEIRWPIEMPTIATDPSGGQLRGTKDSYQAWYYRETWATWSLENRVQIRVLIGSKLLL